MTASWKLGVDALIEEGIEPTAIIDRKYFHSIYFREPSGVLFEIATLSPGFAVDEPADRLGESLMLPERHEPLRSRLEQQLTPLTRIPAPRRPVAERLYNDPRDLGGVAQLG